jgi:hypothetical protein
MPCSCTAMAREKSGLGGSDGTIPAKSGISIIGQVGILGARVRKDACLPREASHAAMS